MNHRQWDGFFDTPTNREFVQGICKKQCTLHLANPEDWCKYHQKEYDQDMNDQRQYETRGPQ